MMPSRSALLTAALFCAAALTPLRPAQGQGQRVYLSVRAFRNAGGLPTEGHDKKLNEQFATGLREYLAEAAQKRFDVSPSPGKSAPPQNARALTLEGELSRSTNPEGGAYLLIARLYEEKPSRHIIAQWAGVAQNYRYLTGNLENRPGVNREGLLGEAGKQIAAFFGSNPVAQSGAAGAEPLPVQVIRALGGSNPAFPANPDPKNP